MRRIVYSCLLLVVFLMSCGGSKDKATKSETTPQAAIVAYYNELIHGRYDRFVAGMQSCDGMPEDYREQMVTLMKQHYEEQREDNGGIKSVSVQNVVMGKTGKTARVFLNVVYNKAESEEIVTSMVLVNGQWRMQ